MRPLHVPAAVAFARSAREVLWLLAGSLMGTHGAVCQDVRAEERRVVSGYASACHALYGDSAVLAEALQERIDQFLLKPGKETLAAARLAWTAGREVYCRTEVFRFYDGPVEELEPLLNAWPVDEAYIDSVAGRPESGIINDPRTWPNIAAAALVQANERGGEANVSVGWHAIEFLLWGQDLDGNGPGDRQAADFADGQGKNAGRRREYLKATSRLLVQHLEQLAAAWAPDADNYRRAFEKDSSSALCKMLTGAAVLTAFELSGERLGVAYETRDQEQEHCCFSDTTCADLVSNQAGLQAVFTGLRDGKRRGPGLLSLVAARSPAAARDLEKKLAASLAALSAIPQPFDRAFLGADDSPGRTAMRAAMAALDEQTEAIAIAGRLLGFELPLKPGG